MSYKRTSYTLSCLMALVLSIVNVQAQTYIKANADLSGIDYTKIPKGGKWMLLTDGTDNGKNIFYLPGETAMALNVAEQIAKLQLVVNKG